MDLNDYPTSPKSIPWKPVALIAAGVIIVIVLAVIIIRLVKKDESFVRQEQSIQEETQTAIEQCETSNNPEACRQAKITDSAAQNAAAQICELLEEGQERDNCYWGVANAAQDPSVCSQISDSSQALRCSDGMYLVRALAQGDSASCDSIQDEDRKIRCKDTLNPVTSQTCAAAGLDEETCENFERSEMAIAKHDISLCEIITQESMKETCVDIILSTGSDEIEDEVSDTDSDGLSNEEEETYGTDPDNPDTDGDSYPDGQEVKAGYNPLGAGNL